jgi:hypothetical protein
MRLLFTIICLLHVVRASSQTINPIDTKEVFIVRPDGFTGWAFVVPSNGIPFEGGRYTIDTAGVVFVPKLESEFRFRLLDSSGADISKNVKLFRKNIDRSQKSDKPLEYYMFYYPTDEQLLLGDDVWSDFEFYEKFTYDAIKISGDLKKSGYFDKSK